MYRLCVALLHILFCANRPAFCAEFEWSRPTDFALSRNWKDGSAPSCPLDHIYFPEKSPSVAINIAVNATKLVLPQEGDLVLNEGGSLVFPSYYEASRSNCYERDRYYGYELPSNWYKPDSWCRRMNKKSGCFPSPIEVENIPAKFDTVTFADSSQYYVYIPRSMSAEVSAMHFQHKLIRSTHQLRKLFQSSNDIRKQFVSASGSSTGRTPSLLITAQRCADVTGCVTNYSQKEIDYVCSLVEKKPPKCKKPLPSSSIEGACSDKCGAIVTFDYSSNFNFENIHNHVHYYAHFDKTDEVKSSIRKLKNGKIQIIIADDEGTYAVEQTKKLMDYLKLKKISGNISNLKVVYSEGSAAGEDHSRPITTAAPPAVAISRGSVYIGVLLALGVFLTALSVLLFINKKFGLGNLWRSFRESNPIAQPGSVHWQRQNNEASCSSGDLAGNVKLPVTQFENPLFQIEMDEILDENSQPKEVLSQDFQGLEPDSLRQD